jgi:nucleoid DNA-binding protein
MTKKERKLLREAAEILKRALAKEGVVRIPGFGKFTATQVTASTTDPLDLHGLFVTDLLVPTVRFKPWKGLKEALGGRVRLCTKQLGDFQWMTCVRSVGHVGECSYKTHMRGM